MSVSKLLPLSGANDFNVAITGTNTVINFTKEYSAGAYTINISGSDTTYDIYIFNADGTSAGYTNTPSLTATKGFSKMVIIGQTAGVLLSFTYKTTYTSSAETSETSAGPVITSVSTASLPNANDTTTVTGINFASDVTVQFTSANTAYTATSAKSVVRNSATSLTVTRPDNMPTTYSPYSLVVANPGVTAPTGSNSHILSNAITAGNAPVWSTSATLPAYTKGVSYSQTVTATDADGGSTVTYSTVSNSLPSGLSITGSGNVISGTPTVLTSGSVTLRATDSGGNYVDRTFTVANIGANAPVWTTTSLLAAKNGTAYSASLVVTDDSGATPTITLASGTLPTGITLSGTTLSGTPTVDGAYSFTLRATDANGSYTDQAFSITIYTVGTWSTVASGLTTLADVNDIYGTTYNGFIYIGGGESNPTGGTSSWSNQWAKVNLTTGVMTVLANGPERDEMSSNWCGSKFYVTGGYYHNSSPIYDTIAIYDDNTNTWSVSASPGFTWGIGRTGSDGTNVYFTASGQAGIMFRYNVSSNTFTTLATGTWTGVSQGARLVYYGGIFYGMHSDSTATGWHMHRYNVSSNTWTASTAATSRDYGSTYFQGGDNYAWGCDINQTGTYIYVYAYDSLQASTTPNSRTIGDTSKPDKILRYNIASDTWTKTSYSDGSITGGSTGTDGSNGFYRLGGYRTNASSQRIYQKTLSKIYLD